MRRSFNLVGAVSVISHLTEIIAFLCSRDLAAPGHRSTGLNRGPPPPPAPTPPTAHPGILLQPQAAPFPLLYTTLNQPSLGNIVKLAHITMDPNVQGGQPCIKGTRIPVYAVLELLQEGLSSDAIIQRYYPDLASDNIKACIQYTAHS